MKNYSKITENKDILTKEYADSIYAKKSSVPAAVTESTVSGWGFTKNKGTVTSVAVKMNGSEKGKVTSSGTIDLGTVITSHQDISGKQDKITSTNKLPASLVSGLATVATSGSYNDLSNKPTIPDPNNLAKLDAENTFTKGQVITGGTSGGYSIDASGYIKGSWLQASSTTNKGSNTGKVCVFDGNGWIYYRTPSEILSEASGVPKSAFSLSGTTLTITI